MSEIKQDILNLIVVIQSSLAPNLLILVTSVKACQLGGNLHITDCQECGIV